MTHDHDANNCEECNAVADARVAEIVAALNKGLESLSADMEDTAVDRAFARGMRTALTLVKLHSSNF